MNKTTYTYPTAPTEEVSLRDAFIKIQEWYFYLHHRLKIVMMVCIIGSISGVIYAYIKKPIYTAECTFVLEDQGGGGALGQYAGIASMVGIDLGAKGSNGIFQGDNIIELYKSRLMIQKTLLSEGDFNGKRDLLINRYLSTNDKLAKNVKAFDVSIGKLNFHHDSILSIVVNDIRNSNLVVLKPDKKLNIISVKVNSEDEMFAKEFTENIVENVNSFYVQTRTKKTLENINILQRQADSVRNVLNLSIGSAAAAMDVNPNANLAMQMLKVASQRKQVDIQASSAIYSEIVKNLEISKISLRQETPLIQVVDSPILPLDKTSISFFWGAIVGGILVTFCAVLFLTAQFLVRSFKAFSF